MCSRYYLTEDFLSDLEHILKDLDVKLRQPLPVSASDIRPAMSAPIIYSEAGQWIMTRSKWGFQGPKGSGIIINARAETVMEKPMFREAAASRRCLIPASGFYEWDVSKNKIRFTAENNETMYFAGIFTGEGEESRFVILTTAANASMNRVHDRMPLILQPSMFTGWLVDASAAADIRNTVPVELKKSSEMEQLRLEI